MPRDEFLSFTTPGAVYVRPPTTGTEVDPPGTGDGSNGSGGPDGDDDLTIETISAGLAIQIDEVSETVTYVGRAEPGSLTTTPVWQIQRLTEVGDDLSVEWAFGNSGFSYVWDDRLILTYA